MIKSFPANTQGKDYICSDIHGHFYLLEAALSAVSFDEDKDRLFSLGDLIDRGNESNQVLDWLAKPWFYAIQGNHERMLINAHESNSDMIRHQWFMWGGDWAEDLDSDEIEPYYEALSTLPLAIELALTDGRTVGLVHAELPNHCNWHDIQSLLATIRPQDVEANRETSDMLWKKDQPMLAPDKLSLVEEVQNIDHVFHGHTILDEYLTIANRSFVDLGSYRTGKIGFFNPVDFLKHITS